MSNLEHEPEIINRYKGAVVGGAVGDAVGAPVEFLRPSEVKVLKEHGYFNEMRGGGSFNWGEGQTTDDTDQTLCIVDSLIANERYVGEDIARRFLLWYQSDPVDVGHTTDLSLSVLANGVSFRESGKIAISLGAQAANGSLMRTAPVGLYFRGHPEDIDRVAGEISAITHADPDCILACQMASHLVALLASGYSRGESVDLLKEMYPFSSQAGNKLRKAFDGGYNSSKFGYVFNTLGIALTSFVEAHNFEEAVTKSVEAGWDTDTQATVAGSFAGALWGVGEIPKRWKSKLNPVSALELDQKAQKLYFLNLAL